MSDLSQGIAVAESLRAEIGRLRAALEAELKFWRNQPSPYRHDERISAIEAALADQQIGSEKA